MKGLGKTGRTLSKGTPLEGSNVQSGKVYAYESESHEAHNQEKGDQPAETAFIAGYNLQNVHS